MGFDPSTAREESGGFDASTAVEEEPASGGFDPTTAKEENSGAVPSFSDSVSLTNLKRGVRPMLDRLGKVISTSATGANVKKQAGEVIAGLSDKPLVSADDLKKFFDAQGITDPIQPGISKNPDEDPNEGLRQAAGAVLSPLTSPRMLATGAAVGELPAVGQKIAGVGFGLLGARETGGQVAQAIDVQNDPKATTAQKWAAWGAPVLTFTGAAAMAIPGLVDVVPARFRGLVRNKTPAEGIEAIDQAMQNAPNQASAQVAQKARDDYIKFWQDQLDHDEQMRQSPGGAALLKSQLSEEQSVARQQRITELRAMIAAKKPAPVKAPIVETPAELLPPEQAAEPQLATAETTHFDPTTAVADDEIPATVDFAEPAEEPEPPAGAGLNLSEMESSLGKSDPEKLAYLNEQVAAKEITLEEYGIQVKEAADKPIEPVKPKLRTKSEAQEAALAKHREEGRLAFLGHDAVTIDQGKTYSPAIKLETGEIISATGHEAAYSAAREAGKSTTGSTRGFATRDGEFLGLMDIGRREMAKKSAEVEPAPAPVKTKPAIAEAPLETPGYVPTKTRATANWDEPVKVTGRRAKTGEEIEVSMPAKDAEKGLTSRIEWLGKLMECLGA